MAPPIGAPPAPPLSLVALPLSLVDPPHTTLRPQCGRASVAAVALPAR
jgi:hypothetical protein